MDFYNNIPPEPRLKKILLTYLSSSNKQNSREPFKKLISKLLLPATRRARAVFKPFSPRPTDAGRRKCDYALQRSPGAPAKHFAQRTALCEGLRRSSSSICRNPEKWPTAVASSRRQYTAGFHPRPPENSTPGQSVIIVYTRRSPRWVLYTQLCCFQKRFRTRGTPPEVEKPSASLAV